VSDVQRLTIVILVVAVVAVWGLGLRAALRSSARTDQGVPANTAIIDAPAGSIATTTSPLALFPTTSPDSALPIPTEAATPILSTSVISTRQPPPTPSPTATSTPQPTATLSPTLPATPTIPKRGRFLVVNQDEQMMHVYENGIEIRAIPASTGRPVANAFTPAWRGEVGRYWGGGPFLNTNLWSDHMWYLFPGPQGSILIHSVPYTRDSDVKIYDRLDALGVEPASSGCVRISPQDAQWLEAWDPVGVPIEITPWSGEIGPPDESL
jgi:lipoprotein-anchoring transpeptidase ErfK/SrfK